MIPIIAELKDPVRNYGISHFFWKFNAQYDKTKLNIVYGEDKVEGKFIIRILKNEIKNNIMGNLVFGKNKIPVFEKPIRVSGKSLGWFLDNYSDKRNIVCAALSGKNEIVIGFDIFNEVGHILSGHLEKLWPFKTREVERLARIPVVDAYEKLLFDYLCMANEMWKVNLSFRSFWPEKKEFAVCLSHDVDIINKSYQYGTHFLRQLKNLNLQKAGYQLESFFNRDKYPNPYWNFEKIMLLEGNLNLRSTFFFLNGKEIHSKTGINAWLEKVKAYDLKNPKLNAIIKKLNQNGWEVGLHARYSSDEGKNLLRQGKNEIESIIKGDVQGVRQHYLDFKVPEIWRLQEKAGFKYDSSIGFRDRAGFRFGTCFPFYPYDPTCKRQMNILEIPLVIMDATVLNKKECWRECKSIVDTVKKYQGVLTLDWHQRVFNEREFPEWKKTYIDIIKYCVKENAWVKPMTSIYGWWENKWSNFEK